MKEIYINIIKTFLDIPLVNNSIDNLEELDEKLLDNIISHQVIPQTINFYGYIMENNKNYLDILEKIINEIKKSPKHINELHTLIESLNK